jgi:outer membrane biosynthesis protein TonB
MAASQLGIAIPNFWFAILLILLFAVHLQWVSAGGFPGWTEDDGGGVGAGLQALILPAVALDIVADAAHDDRRAKVAAQGVQPESVDAPAEPPPADQPNDQPTDPNAPADPAQPAPAPLSTPAAEPAATPTAVYASAKHATTATFRRTRVRPAAGAHVSCM